MSIIHNREEDICLDTWPNRSWTLHKGPRGIVPFGIVSEADLKNNISLGINTKYNLVFFLNRKPSFTEPVTFKNIHEKKKNKKQNEQHMNTSAQVANSSVMM